MRDEVNIPERTGRIKEIHVMSDDIKYEGQKTYSCTIVFSEQVGDYIDYNHHTYRFECDRLDELINKIQEIRIK